MKQKTEYFDLEYPNNEEDYENEKAREKYSTVVCNRCGERSLFINYIPAPYCGCYLKVKCQYCEAEEVLFDCYS